MGGFPKRFRKAVCPAYPEAEFRILANPDGALYDALLMGDSSTDERAAALGAALQEAYGGDKVEAYGVVFDFSTPQASIATINAPATPIDLRIWLRNAPTDLVSFEREETRSNYRASFDRGN